MNTPLNRPLIAIWLLTSTALMLAGCNDPSAESGDSNIAEADLASEAISPDLTKGRVYPDRWPALEPLPLNSEIEARIDEIMPLLSLEQKVGQVIQGDSASLTPEDVKKYRLGSVLSGGNSAPGPKPYAEAQAWLQLADEYYQASVDPDGVEVAIPVIWGIDAVHGHANLTGAIIFPHNIGLGATGNPDLIEEIARITAFELTVSGHDWTFAPTLALPQDLRWGRSYEGFSEDPEIVSAYASRVVYGLQGRLDEKDFMGDGRVISSAKHFLADGATRDGVDQGDAEISEAELRDVHAAGYYSAIPAGVQTVMASFSSWQGEKLHGHKQLLTDVLKGQLGFNGFVVGDWNGHGQVPGCTNTDCPASLLAGLDMYMAPDSWKGLYESTLAHAKSGVIPMERLDDAVRRILRVKLASGLFEKGAPSRRTNAGDENRLGLPEHRAIARQAVRESLVLLKNNQQLLPLDASKTFLVIGDGADNVAKPAGGWTLSWQGGIADNAEFPNAETILDGLRAAVEKEGGRIIFAPNGKTDEPVDAVIAVYGENPYAEFQGDLENLDFNSGDAFDVSQLSHWRDQDVSVVSVFLSGRPMWVNPEINASDAFVAAWLPGSEGGGVADLLFQTDADFDFTGTLPFAWPASARVSGDSASHKESDDTALFDLGYGLNYRSQAQMQRLSEDSGLDSNKLVAGNLFYEKGNSVSPWQLSIGQGGMSGTGENGENGEGLTKKVASYPTSFGGMLVSKTDYSAQEDALRLKWTRQQAHYDIAEQLRIHVSDPVDLSRQSNGGLELVFVLKSFDGSAQVMLGMGVKDMEDCGQSESSSSCAQFMPLDIDANSWTIHRVSLSCFNNLDMRAIDTVFMLSSANPVDLGLAHVRLESDLDATQDCPSASGY